MLYPASRSLFNPTLRFSLNIIPIDDRNIRPGVMTEVWASARIVDLQYHILTMLQAEMFIGPDLHSPLDILPM